MRYLTIDRVKQHLNIDASFTADDTYIAHLIDAAERAIALRIDRKLDDCANENGQLPQTIEHSILLLVGGWYANREPYSTLSISQLPQSFEWLADLEKSYISGF